MARKTWRSFLVPGVKGRSYYWEQPPYEGLSVEDVDSLIDMIDKAFHVRMRRLRAFKGSPEEFFQHVLKRRDFSIASVGQRYLERKKTGRPKGAVSKLLPEDRKLLAEYDASGKPVKTFAKTKVKPHEDSEPVRSKLRRLRKKRARGQLVE